MKNGIVVICLIGLAFLPVSCNEYNLTRDFEGDYLHVANQVMWGDFKNIDKNVLLKNIDTVGKRKRTLLNLAFFYRKYDAIEYLLDNNANIYLQPSPGYSTYNYIALYNDKKLYEIVKEYKLNIRPLDDGRTDVLLSLLSSTITPEKLDIYLSHIDNLHLPKNDELHPLVWGANSQIEFFEVLLDYVDAKVDISILQEALRFFKLRYQDNPNQEFMNTKYARVLKKLEALIAEAKKDEYGLNGSFEGDYLRVATQVMAGDFDSIDKNVLLKNIDNVGYRNRTLLWSAFYYKKYNAINFLLENKANFEIQPVYGKTLPFLIGLYGDKKLYEIVEKYKLNIRPLDDDSRDPLVALLNSPEILDPINPTLTPEQLDMYLSHIDNLHLAKNNQEHPIITATTNKIEYFNVVLNHIDKRVDTEILYKALERMDGWHSSANEEERKNEINPVRQKLEDLITKIKEAKILDQNLKLKTPALVPQAF